MPNAKFIHYRIAHLNQGKHCSTANIECSCLPQGVLEPVVGEDSQPQDKGQV